MSMLPFLKHKKEAQSTGLIVKERAPDQPTENTDENAALEACASDIISAIKAGNISALAQALKAAHEVCASAPMADDESYDAQNVKAADYSKE